MTSKETILTTPVGDIIGRKARWKGMTGRYRGGVVRGVYLKYAVVIDSTGVLRNIPWEELELM